ncbi:MAG: hypothetical protein WC477_07370, partial [Patescibacteria group bacterium]
AEKFLAENFLAENFLAEKWMRGIVRLCRFAGAIDLWITPGYGVGLVYLPVHSSTLPAHDATH